jgi:hypothetical protein
MEPLVEPCRSYRLYTHCHRDIALLPMPLLRLCQWSTGSPLRNPLHDTAIFSPGELESSNAHFTADTSLIASSSNGIYIGSACIQLCVHVRDLPYQHGKQAVTSFDSFRHTLHQLEGSDRLTKLFTVVYILYRMIKSRLHEPGTSSLMGFQLFGATDKLPKGSATENQSF